VAHDAWVHPVVLAFGIAVSNRSRRIVILAFGVALLVTYSRLITFAPDMVTYEIIEAARNLSRGQGLVTNAATPVFVTYYTSLTPPFPYLWYPLVPIVTSGLFWVFGAHPRLVVVFPMVMYLLSGLAVFELGRRLFNPLTGLLAGIVLLAQPWMLRTTARENFSDPVLVALLVSTVLCVFVASDDSTRRQRAWLIGGGILLGLCQYARWAATTMYVPMLFLIVMASPRRRFVRATTFLLACLATQLPLFIWNFVHIGRFTLTPTYVFLFATPSFPAESSLVSVLPPDFPVFQQYGREVVLKWIGQMWVHYKYFFEMTSPLLLVGAMMFGFTAIPQRQRVLWMFAVVLYLTIAGLNSWFMWYNRFLLPVVPFVAILGVEFIRAMLVAAPVPALVRAVAAAVLAVVVIAEPADLFYQLSKARLASSSIAGIPNPRAAFMKANLRPGDVVMAFDAPLIAWETGNVAVGLPLSPAKGTMVRDRHVKFNTLVLETRRPRVDIFGFAEDWYQIARGEKEYLDFRVEQITALSADQRLVLLRSAN
jgi:hypothetical protein